jgi:hypothetical protein
VEIFSAAIALRCSAPLRELRMSALKICPGVVYRLGVEPDSQLISFTILAIIA